MQTIDFKTSFKDQQTINTQKERERCLDMGMTELTPNEVNETLLAIGFKLDNTCTFDYYNTGNEISYLAKSCSIVDIKTKKSFANVDFGNIEDERDRRAELQKIRRSCFGWDGKRVWDL